MPFDPTTSGFDESALNSFLTNTDLTDLSKKQPIFLENFRGESDYFTLSSRTYSTKSVCYINSRRGEYPIPSNTLNILNF